MDVTVADSGSCRRTLSIKISNDKVKAHLDEVFKNASQQVQIKGFRPGKVPRSVLEKKYGDEIRGEAKESLINSAFEDALREKKMIPLGRPKVDGLDDSPLTADSTLEFQVEFDVRPEFEVGTTKGLEVKQGETEVSDEDMEAALNQLANEHRTLNTVDEPVGDGDFAKLDLTYLNEAGETVSERQGAQLNTTIPLAGTDPETFAARLTGAEKDQELELELTFPDTFEKEEVRGEKGTVKMKVAEVLRVTPAPIDDDLAKKFDFDDLETMKGDLHKRLGEEKTRVNKVRQEEEAISHLANAHPFDLPESMVEEQMQHNLRNFAERLKQAGIDETETETRVKGAENDAREDAERRVRTFFLLDAVAKKEKIFVTENDVDLELRNIATQNNVSVSDVRDHYEEHKLLPDLRLGLMERKVRDFLRENAKLTD